MASKQKKLQHLFLRAGFGETPEYINSLLDKSISSTVDELFKASKDYQDINYLPYPIPEDAQMEGMGIGKILKTFLKSYQEKEDLNNEWISRMSTTQAMLREKMTFFWHNHFATNTPFAYLMQVQNNTLRKYALGNFSDLLRSIAKDPAMILYLNNEQNKKAHPNENFAREVMELFTLGVGNYTENDVKASARAFTGWTLNGRAEFQFNERQHDTGEKVFLGQKGDFDGDDILDIILSQKQTAVFIITKIYREFVNPDVDDKRVQELADGFFKSGYDISGLMRNIYTSDWFYDDENIGTKVCSPVELIVRYKKMTDVDCTNPKTILNLQKALGQVLFFPPNVAGWKGGNAWIDSSSLLLRLSIPQYVLRGEGLQIKVKPHPEEAPDDKPQDANADKGLISSDWTALTTAFQNLPGNTQQESMLNYFIQCDTSRIDRNLIKMSWGNKNVDSLTLQMAAIMSLPEFQLI
jgi:uncharacterized protein (DUF1800 family)